MVGTFHAAGDSAAYRLLRRPRCAGWRRRLDLRLRRVEGRRGAGRAGTSVATTRCCSTASSSTRFRPGRRRTPTDGARRSSSAAATSTARASTCCSRRWRQLPADVRCGSPATGPTPRALQARYAGDPRIEWLGRISDDEKIARLRGATCSARRRCGGESFGVVLLEAMAAGTPVVASRPRRLPQRGHARACDALLVPPGDADALAARCGGCSPTTPCAADLLVAVGRGAGRRVLDGPARRALRRASTSSSSPTRPRGRRPATARRIDAERPVAAADDADRRLDGDRMIVVLIIVLVLVVLLVFVVVDLQRADPAAQPGRERLVADRRAAQAPLRPDPQPGRDGQGLRRPRARDARGRHPGPQPRRSTPRAPSRPGRRPRTC